MDTQIRSAKAVVDIDEVHFLKHTSGEPAINQALLENKQDWFSVATLKGSVECTQDALSLTKINIDQSGMPIGISTEPGDFNLSFSMPSLVKANLEKWLSGKSDTALTIDGKTGYGFDFNLDLHEMVCAIKTKTKEWFIFPNIQGSVCLAKEDTTWLLKFSGMVLGASNEGNNDVYILADDAVAGSGE